jgi:hypothetical protein
MEIQYERQAQEDLLDQLGELVVETTDKWLREGKAH